MPLEEKFRPIARQKKADLIAEEVRHWIVSRSVRPGARLPQEKDLIAHFKASRASVREALKILESQGLVDIQPGPNGGARISSISFEVASRQLRNFFYFDNLSWAQIYAMRERLEPELTALVAGRLSEEQFAELEATVAVCGRGMEGQVDEAEHRIAELRFHKCLAAACPDPLLRFLCRFINDLLTDLVLFRSVIGPDDTAAFGTHNLCAHREILDALRAGDGASAQRLMQAHIHQLGCFLSEREQSVEPRLLLSSSRRPLPMGPEPWT